MAFTNSRKPVSEYKIIDTHAQFCYRAKDIRFFLKEIASGQSNGGYEMAWLLHYETAAAAVSSLILSFATAI